MGYDFFLREFNVKGINYDALEEVGVWNETLELVFGYAMVEEDERGNRTEKKLRRTERLREYARRICEYYMYSPPVTKFLKELGVELGD